MPLVCASTTSDWSTMGCLPQISRSLSTLSATGAAGTASYTNCPLSVPQPVPEVAVVSATAAPPASPSAAAAEGWRSLLATSNCGYGSGIDDAPQPSVATIATRNQLGLAGGG